MPHRRRRRPAVVVLAALLGLVGVSWLGSAPGASAHGSTQRPASRTYACRFEQPSNPMCAAAWSADSQALYDWMEVNLGDVDGRHRERIPDGQLCSAGRSKYAAFDAPGSWPLTALVPAADGRVQVVYTSTAPHATAYVRLYLTRDGFDARTDRLRWDDLSLVYDSGALPASSRNAFPVALPARVRPAILYAVWQRSDSPEAFYACSDVTVGPGGPGGSTTTTVRPASTTTTTTRPASTTTTATGVPSGDEPWSPVAGIEARGTTTSAWAGGRCVEVRVTNTSAAPLSWEVHLRPGGSFTSVWNGVATAQHHAGHEGHVAFVGESWNARLAAGSWTSFGYCVRTG